MSSAAELPRRGLGRGLEVLVGAAAGRGHDLVQLPVVAIEPNPRQPRRQRPDPDVAALAQSLRGEGMVQPVVVRPRPDGRYELIAGERRWRAARAAGMATIPALVREVDDRDSLLLALVENVARKQLSAVEEARAYAVLTDEFGLSLAEVARRVGRSKPTVSNRMRLLELSDEILDLVESGALSEAHARAVLAVPDGEERKRLARRIVSEGLSARAAERGAQVAGARRKPRRKLSVDPALAERARSAGRLVTGVTPRVRSGYLEFTFDDEHALAELVEALEQAAAAAAVEGD